MFRKYAYLLALARERHFGRAAAACHVSQPTLSNAIRQLEADLGVPIVERGQRFSGFTPEGHKVLEHARRILAEQDGLQQELAALAEGVTGHLTLGAIPTALPAVGLLLARFQERHPHIRARVRSLSSRDIQRGLDEFALDAAVTYLDNEPLSHVRTVPLYGERYFLLALRSLLPAGQESIGWAGAADLPLCLLSEDMQNRRIADAAFAMVGRTVSPAVESNSISTLYAMVRAGLGAAVVPGQLLTLVAAHPDLLALPLTDPDLTHAVGLVYADRDPPAPLARVLAVVAGDGTLCLRLRQRSEEALASWRR